MFYGHSVLGGTDAVHLQYFWCSNTTILPFKMSSKPISVFQFLVIVLWYLYVFEFVIWKYIIVFYFSKYYYGHIGLMKLIIYERVIIVPWCTNIQMHWKLCTEPPLLFWLSQ